VTDITLCHNGLREDGLRKEAAMVYQDFFFLMLMVIFLYFAKREAGHWKH